MKVHIDYHVEFEGHRYSVSHALVGQTLELRVTRTTLEFLNRGQRVCSHFRVSNQLSHLELNRPGICRHL